MKKFKVGELYWDTDRHAVIKITQLRRPNTNFPLRGITRHGGEVYYYADGKLDRKDSVPTLVPMTNEQIERLGQELHVNAKDVVIIDKMDFDLYRVPLQDIYSLTTRNKEMALFTHRLCTYSGKELMLEQNVAEELQQLLLNQEETEHAKLP